LEIAGRVHFLHDFCDFLGGLVFLDLLEHDVGRNVCVVFLLQLFVFHEGVGHDSTDLFKVLQHVQPRLLLLR